jgi:hypothetical protein
MDISNLPPAIIAQATKAVEDYILDSRKEYAGRALPLEAAQRTPLEPFFPGEVLDHTRFCMIGASRIEDPPFYTMVKMMGLRNLPDFSNMAAITFVDVVVSHEEFTDALLFHELVHAVQYAQLGTTEFASHYVNGFIKGGSYEEIPLEKNAYELEARFSKHKAAAFSVADAVKQWVDEERF